MSDSRENQHPEQTCLQAFREHLEKVGAVDRPTPGTLDETMAALNWHLKWMEDVSRRRFE